MTKQTRIVGACLEVLPMMREARRRIVEYFGGVGFADLYRRLEPLPEGETNTAAARQKKERLFIPGAVLEYDLMEELGVDVWRVIVPEGMLRKEKSNHPEVKASDYLMLQRIVDGDLVYHDLTEGRAGTHMFGIAQDEHGKWWFAAWKKTKDGRELFFNTFHRISGRSLRQALGKDGKKIERRKK